MGFGLQDEAEVSIMTTLKDKDISQADKRGLLVEEILHRLDIATLEDTGEILYYREEFMSAAENKRYVLSFRT